MSESELTSTTSTTIPRWTEDFDINAFDVQSVFREATAQRKSVGKLLKSLGYPVGKFISTEVPEFKSSGSSGADGNIPVTASSTAIDLSGDDFSPEALEQMKAACVGTTVFLNHEYDVPEDVYGKVAAAEIAKRKVFNPVTGENGNHACLDLSITPVGEDENPRAVNITNMLRKSRLKLGVSVTVLVLEWKKRADGGRTITKVFYLESSMVGIPCNQTAWADGSATTGKSFTPANSTEESAIVMAEESNTANGTTGTATDATYSLKAALAAALAAEATKKGILADELAERRASVHLVWDAFWTCFYNLRRAVSSGATVDIPATAQTLVTELAAELLPSLILAFNDAEGDDMFVCYAAQIERLGEFVAKAGARNSGRDAATIQSIHDLAVTLEAACQHSTDGTGDEAQKSASVADLSAATTKAAELETKVASLTAEKNELEQQLETALKAAEAAVEQLQLEKATSLTAVTALERFGREPLPRAGVSVS